MTTTIDRAAAIRALPLAASYPLLAETLIRKGRSVDDARAALSEAGGRPMARPDATRQSLEVVRQPGAAITHAAPASLDDAEARGANEARTLMQPKAAADPYAAMQDARAAETARIERDGAAARAGRDEGAAEARALLGRA